MAQFAQPLWQIGLTPELLNPPGLLPLLHPEGKVAKRTNRSERLEGWAVSLDQCPLASQGKKAFLNQFSRPGRVFIGIGDLTFIPRRNADIKFREWLGCDVLCG